MKGRGRIRGARSIPGRLKAALEKGLSIARDRGLRDTSRPLLRIAAGWVVAYFALLSLLDFHPIVRLGLTESPVFPRWTTFLLLVAGSLGMVSGYRGIPTRTLPDLSPMQARFGLGIVFIAAAFLRLYRFDQPPVRFWDDWADGMVWANILLDKDRFYWMFPTDGREPFFPYLTMGLMAIFPDSVRDFIIRRFAGWLVDLVALWMLYLSGKELGSRRAGLVAAALGALGRPMLQLTLTGMRALTLSLAVSFMLLVTLKVVRKPTFGHFLLWGFALAFGVHTYSSFRVFMLAVPFLLLAWILMKGKERSQHPTSWLAGIGAVLLLLGVYSGTLAATFPFFSAGRAWWEALAARPWGMAGLFLACLGLAGHSLWASHRKGRGTSLPGWALSLGMASAMVYPISRSVGFTERITGLSPFQQAHDHGLLVQLAGRCWETLKAMFYFIPEREDLRVGADPFLDLFSQGALVLALAFLVARWDARKWLLLILGTLGSAVYVLSIDPASTKLAGSAPPLFLLAGWAVSSLWSGFQGGARKRKASASPRWLVALLVLYGLWGGTLQFQKLHGYWARTGLGDEPTDTMVARSVWEYEKSYRVYLAPADWFFGWNSQCVLNQGRRYYILKPTNSVPEPDGEEAEGILVLVFGADPTTQATLRRDFPSARWEKVLINPDLARTDPNPELYFYRVFIPPADLSADPQALLFRKGGKGPWLRRYYNPVYGWRLTGILREARVPRFSFPIPADELFSSKFMKYNHARLVRSMGMLSIEEEGNYEFAAEFADPALFKIDGRIFWKKDKPRPGGRIRFQVRLGRGDHSLDIKVRLVDVLEVPEVRWRKKGAAEWRVL